MKLLHLADLHIGKRVNGFSMLEDQKYILQEILRIAGEEAVDAVLIAGDVYDKSIPSEEAVAYLDDFLVELLKLVGDVFLISGNHDSAERVSFGSRIMEESGLHIAPIYDGTIRPYRLEKNGEEIQIWLFPYLRPTDIRRYHPQETVTDYNEAFRLVTEELDPDREKCNIALAHQFITGGSVSDSEEHIGSLENVDVSVFDAFDYVALGHLHGPQKVGRETVRYAGSPLKYSFSELHQKKSVTLVKTAGKEIQIEIIPLKPMREMQVIEGSFEEIRKAEFVAQHKTDDYMRIVLTDQSDVFNAGAILRNYYPNWMILEYKYMSEQSEEAADDLPQIEGKSPLEIFGELFQKQNRKPMSGEQEDFLGRLMEELEQAVKEEE